MDWHGDPRGACTYTGIIPLRNIEAAGGSVLGPTRNAYYRALARTHSSPDSPLSILRASDPLSTTVHHDSLRRFTINKRCHPWRVGSSWLLIRTLMKSMDFGARDSGTVKKLAWHHRHFTSAFTADQELQYRKGCALKSLKWMRLSFTLSGTDRSARCQTIEWTGLPQLSKVIGKRPCEVKATQIPIARPLPRGVCARPRRS